MTTIAYKHGVMAADSRAYGAGLGSIGSKLKIRRLPDGRLIGATTPQVGAGEAILDWYAAGADVHNTPEGVKGSNVGLLVVHPDGRAQVASGAWTLTGMLESPYFVVGSGSHYAEAILESGGTSQQAVEIACKFDSHSGLPVVSLMHGAPCPSPRHPRRAKWLSWVGRRFKISG
ncbi:MULTISPECIES: hypothetical protein [Mesorhizobium]|uniref:hypothetical protein n=1 Tax=Mesorhizobium TaxID=68287 RepID=UPI0007ED9641|nr:MULTISPECIES: hypothetical protein [Mesorhizobium]TPJ43720.1 hypothetical protein FJ437_20365 [Mesorhizobium sp. B2-6-6]ARP67347.1 hypothetical protein A9K65_031555 [Mesorhizobium sp. WSM1497]MCA0002924.1 hypothetical protein [Mesorhizobium sp. B264B2A]MCA0009210.1 hypothetical protein [Mesorhizobium sp. B264B1B]MCA0013989.1 hypothetical protein [Mesorhizobium sp. B294B1A1]